MRTAASVASCDLKTAGQQTRLAAAAAAACAATYCGAEGGTQIQVKPPAKTPERSPASKSPCKPTASPVWTIGPAAPEGIVAGLLIVARDDGKFSFPEPCLGRFAREWVGGFDAEGRSR